MSARAVSAAPARSTNATVSRKTVDQNVGHSIRLISKSGDGPEYQFRA